MPFSKQDSEPVFHIKRNAKHAYSICLNILLKNLIRLCELLLLFRVFQEGWGFLVLFKKINIFLYVVLNLTITGLAFFLNILLKMTAFSFCHFG